MQQQFPNMLAMNAGLFQQVQPGVPQTQSPHVMVPMTQFTQTRLPKLCAHDYVAPVEPQTIYVAMTEREPTPMPWCDSSDPRIKKYSDENWQGKSCICLRQFMLVLMNRFEWRAMDPVAHVEIYLPPHPDQRLQFNGSWTSAAQKDGGVYFRSIEASKKQNMLWQAKREYVPFSHTVSGDVYHKMVITAINMHGDLAKSGGFNKEKMLGAGCYYLCGSKMCVVNEDDDGTFCADYCLKILQQEPGSVFEGLEPNTSVPNNIIDRIKGSLHLGTWFQNGYPGADRQAAMLHQAQSSNIFGSLMDDTVSHQFGQ